MRYIWRYILWLLVIIGLVVVVIILLLPNNSKKKITGTNFVNYSSTDAVASLLIDGPEGTDSSHEAVRISVDQSQIVYQQLAGYNYNPVKTETFTNTQSAYAVFLRSIYIAGFTKGNTSPKSSNPNGFCPLGDRYIFNFNNVGQSIVHFWGTNCGNKTYGGDLGLTTTLFQNQVPNYSNLTQNLNL